MLKRTLALVLAVLMVMAMFSACSKKDAGGSGSAPAEAKEWNFSKVKQVIYHPAFAGSMAAIALVVTLILH